MTFKLRSGNKTSFKNMGSSPNKFDIGQIASIAGEVGNIAGKGSKIGKMASTVSNVAGMVGKAKDYINKRRAEKAAEETTTEEGSVETDSPAKHVPVKTKGLGPRTSFGGSKNPELTKKSAPKKPRKVMKDGPKNKVHFHDGRENKDPHWQPHQFRTPAKKVDEKYWYKINGKKATKAEYNAYKNEPGKMEGGGKTTNDPDASGRKAATAKARSKNKASKRATVLTKAQTKAKEKNLGPITKKRAKEIETRKHRENWEPAFPGADHSKEELKKMTEKEKQDYYN